MRRELRAFASVSKIYDINADFGTVSTDRAGRLGFFFAPDNGIGRALRRDSCVQASDVEQTSSFQKAGIVP